jgi:hypothetical protein
LVLNQPTILELLYDKPQIGNSQYGEYYLYSVRNGDGATEYSYFAPPEVHDKLKELKRGTKIIITKSAEQKGNKIVTKYDINPEKEEQVIENVDSFSDNYYELMLKSCRDAVKIQNELGGLMDAKSVAVTLFIARSKTNGCGG